MPILQPSFRGRLRLFFAVIVVVPMIAVAIVLFQLLGANDTGKINSRLAEAQVAATGLFNEERDAARAAVKKAEDDVDLATAINDKKPADIRSQLQKLASEAGIERIRLEVDGQGTFDVGRRDVVAPFVSDLANSKGEAIGRMT